MYYAPDGITSEDFPGGAFEDYEASVLAEAFGEDLARLLWDGGDPLRVLCQTVVERITCPKVVSLAGGWGPGTDSWSNTWVADMSEALSTLRPLLQRYLAGLEFIQDLEVDRGTD